MYVVESAAERSAKASLQRRRDREAERKERIFNDKLRTIGVDHEALDKQVKEKQKQEVAEKEKQKAYDAEVLHNSNVADILHHRQEKKKRAMQMDLVNYWQQHQQPRSQQMFDLNNTEDAPISPPVFEGEDLGFENRLKWQREQLREWLNQQQSEQAAERHRQRLEEQRDDRMRLEMDNRALQLQSQEMERRRAEAVATKEFNLAKTAEKRQQERNDEDNRGVDVDPALGRWGVPGLCPGTDLRAPPETLEQVLQFQKIQIEEKKRIELERKREEELQHRNNLASARSALLIERQQAKINKQMRQQLQSTNIQMAETHRQQKPDIERGRIDDSFFSYFNTCSR
ncbi:RIB43A-like with coiled-coils protein 2 [Paralichthys olivaceus]|uniref:RIB43A-like with coiled-coils protein 2 n=1 Tax=Paralichthys olivaceus TaxID=8255 RepID=UPI003752F9C5